MFLWIISFLLELPNFIGWGDHVYDKKTQSCVWDRTADYSYTLFFCIVAIATPIALISICYLKIFLYVRASKKRVAKLLQFNSNLVDKPTVKRMKESMKLARTLFAIFVAFALCWSPYAIVIMADYHDTWSVEPHLFSVMLAHTSSSVNCLLYGLTNSHFRKGYGMIVSMARIRKSDSHQEGLTLNDDENIELTTTPIEASRIIDDGIRCEQNVTIE